MDGRRSVLRAVGISDYRNPHRQPNQATLLPELLRAPCAANLAALLRTAHLHVRRRAAPRRLGGADRVRKVVAVVGLSVLSPEFPDRQPDQRRRAARRHLVARDRGAVLSRLAARRSLLFAGCDRSLGDRRHLSLTVAAAVVVVGRRESVYECVLPPRWSDGGRASR